MLNQSQLLHILTFAILLLSSNLINTTHSLSFHIWSYVPLLKCFRIAKRQRRREKAKNYACEKLPEYKVFHWNLKCTKQDSETILTVKTMEKKLYDTCVVFLKFAIQWQIKYFFLSKQRNPKFILQKFYERFSRTKKKFMRGNKCCSWLTSYEKILAVHHKRRHNNSRFGEKRIQMANKSKAWYLEDPWEYFLSNPEIRWTLCPKYSF